MMKFAPMNSLSPLALAWSLPAGLSLFCAALAAVFFAWPGLRAPGRGWWFAAGLAMIMLVYASPADALAREYLLTADAFERVTAALMATWLLALDLGASPRMRTPGPAKPFAALAWIAGMGTLTACYVPGLYNLELASPAARAALVIGSIATGLWFWLPLLGPPSRGRLKPVPAGIWYLLGAAMWCSILGLGIAFARPSLIRAYDAPPDTLGILTAMRGQFGLTRAEDQETAGLLFWIGSCSVLLCGVMLLFYRWYVSDAVRKEFAGGVAESAKKTREDHA